MNKLCHRCFAGHGTENMPITVNIFGGDISLNSALSVINLENPEANGEIYDNWASSVKDFPQIIEKKVVRWFLID